MIKNYTSSISVDRSVSYIEKKLVQHGARDILKRFGGDGRITGICFNMAVNGLTVPFQLPSKTAACEKILRENLSPRARPETHKKIKEQAERTSWKILSDWVEAQMAMIELAQVDFMEVFMPYMFDPTKEKTVYQIAAESNFKKLLPAGCIGQEKNNG